MPTEDVNKTTDGNDTEP